MTDNGVLVYLNNILVFGVSDLLMKKRNKIIASGELFLTDLFSFKDLLELHKKSTLIGVGWSQRGKRHDYFIREFEITAAQRSISKCKITFTKAKK